MLMLLFHNHYIDFILEVPQGFNQLQVTTEFNTIWDSGLPGLKGQTKRQFYLWRVTYFYLLVEGNSYIDQVDRDTNWDDVDTLVSTQTIFSRYTAFLNYLVIYKGCKVLPNHEYLIQFDTYVPVEPITEGSF